MCIRDSPYCQYQSTVSMFEAMMGGLQYIAKKENLSRMDPSTPVYFFSGDQDPVGGMGKGVKKVVEMFRQAGCRDVTLRLYPCLLYTSTSPATWRR